MGRQREQIETTHAVALAAYEQMTGRTDGLDRIERVLLEALEKALDQWVTSRFSDWDPADLLTYANIVAAHRKQIAAEAEARAKKKQKPQAK